MILYFIVNHIIAYRYSKFGIKQKRREPLIGCLSESEALALPNLWISNVKASRPDVITNSLPPYSMR